jgi:MarR family transcriptional regulator, organic hydroperoxide resistance regulator
MVEILPDSLDELAGLYWFVQKAIQERTITDWVEADLSAAQLKTLFLVTFKKPSNVNHLSSLLGVGQPTASHLVEKLVQVGLLERSENPQDRRSVQVRTSAAGQELVRRLWQGRREFLRSWLERLNSNEIDALWKGLSALQQIAMADSPEQIEQQTQGIKSPII